ncbi:helix-turn-helix domain-containing protein [Carnobacterium divergens]|uniref:helix-turn-helix domain-containing protein n=1 Tax=Carnobacterium divergens TaxID=2748 RepID=UPI00288CDDC0|nr:helix-turn-helix domain-containing protein [Carnobacterium divergens]MDT2012380.1 helix-turn-helix domain-containing protein [Carnobacterium divergens]
MNKTIEKLIIEKDIRRQLTILSLLESGKIGLTYGEISIKLNCSKRTVLNDFEKIRGLLPENWEIETTRKSGLYLKKCPYEPMAILYEKVLNQSPMVEILKGLLVNKQCSIGEWSEVLHIGEDTTKKYFKKLNTILLEFDLTIHPSKLIIEGDEINIRYFYSRLLFSSSEIVSVRKENSVTFRLFQEFFEAILEKQRFQIDLAVSWSYIIAKRLECDLQIGLYSDSDLSLFYKESFLKYEKPLNKLLNSLKLENSISLCREEQEFLFIVLLEASLSSEVVVDEHPSIFNNATRKMLECCMDFSAAVCRNTSLKGIEKEYGEHCYQLLNTKVVLGKVSKLLQKTEEGISLEVEASYGDWLDVIKGNSKLLPSDLITEISYFEDLMIELTLLLIACQSQHQQDKKIVVLAVNSYPIWLQFVRENLEVNLNRSIEFVDFCDKPSAINEIILLQPDVVITNQKLDFPKELLCIWISKVPSFIEMQQVIEKVHRLM